MQSDFDALQRLYGANYRRLYQILAAVSCSAACRHPSLHDPLAASLFVVEQTRYTTLLLLRAAGSIHRCLAPIELQVRMYHDMQVAEVVPGINRLLPRRGERGGSCQYGRDEKKQLNLLLAQWLDNLTAIGGAPGC